MDEKVQATLDKIIKLAQQNHEFDTELRKRLRMTSSAISVHVSSTSIKDDVTAIREALEIRANKSISYDFIKEQRLRDQLIIDNLRMENAALNLQDNENERFYSFCVNAFYQIENIVNYYFYCRYPKINDLLTCIENATENEAEKHRFHRNGKEKTVGDIAISDKLNAICNILFPKDKVKITYSQLKQVRNEGAHRCMVIMKDKDENSSLYRFFKYNSFNTIRIKLIKLVYGIKDALTAKIEETEVIATITSLLPSACFIRFNGTNIQLPNRFFNVVQGLRNGDSITIILRNDNIVKVTK